MRNRNREAEADEAQIDLTPMLDVVFIMLIFFIVVASFLKEAGIEVNRPDSNQNPPETDSESIVVTITGDNQIWMENRRIDIRAVRANVARVLASDPEAGFTVKTEPGASAGTLLEVGDAAREAGVKQVSWPAEEKQ
ncbi:biopolymer transporter ExbD [Halioglobus japonicus]|uniref:Biopolymer transporter ExbD n=1 Tax=Halioglobus japonicus TaxID=930805 RepID=A0AAP8SMD7_9GAMM|nr:MULTISPECIES: biopolymer transporter ExbD [Halioglobus]KZX56124.1 biopolymer transporter ExbD [Halioglobus sp. HI00S01]PLW85470.1 biopolymer transporter ExbD [Halioglobus japonicus]GHD15799.1 biopolymer transporter ExbD [Halioglobus japonicus]